MAENSSVFSNLANNFNNMPMAKQAGALLALSASVAIGFYVVLWAQEPLFTPVLPHIDPKDVNEVMVVLDQEQIPYRLDQNTGTILVLQDKLQLARIALATKGLPQSNNLSGFELLDKNQPFGSSQFLESVRYRRALEGELSKTISSMQAVSSARVHLAIPKEAIFLKDKDHPTASVMVEVQQGRELQKSQVKAIVHLIASSIPNMQSDDVTVVDQSGRLLSAGGDDEFTAISENMDHVRQIESTLNKRILDLLTPIIGNNRVRAEVNADIDFTTQEETHESYDPKSQVLRSERTTDEKRMGGAIAGGIPGALSNQPSQTGTAPEKTSEITPVGETSGPASNKSQATRNYELDKSIRHVRLQPGKIQKITAAILVDDKIVVDKKGKETKQPFTEEELKKIENMVKDAIGFDAKRGDKVSVINTPFVPEPKIEPTPPENIYEQPWVIPLAKQILAGLFILIVMLRVVRPYFKSMSTKPEGAGMLEYGGGMQLMPPSENKVFITPQEQPLKLPNLSRPGEQSLHHVAEMVKEDPKRVAKVVMNWVGNEDE